LVTLAFSSLRHSDCCRIIEPDLRLALAKPRFRTPLQF